MDVDIIEEERERRRDLPPQFIQTCLPSSLVAIESRYSHQESTRKTMLVFPNNTNKKRSAEDYDTIRKIDITKTHV